ncbi:MAG: pirin family protein [Flavobacteriales bacterium]|jgi:hypothetical protein|nr:pirin family protein [Flavobacteriales bacterium]PWM08831.1 MAG: hypothetical protein DBY00_09535 [Flavobacteriales bacterium]
MKTILHKAATRGHADHGWLDTYHTFSFASYFNPERVHFGALRVLNDDKVAPSEGFGMHPHQNMEVISIPLKGYLRHGDSIENSSVITPGTIQVMSTGTGIYHSEYNDSATEPLEFLQIWVFPKKENTKPKYDNFDIRHAVKRNELSLIVSPEGNAPASILQDAWFSIGKLDKGVKKTYDMHREDTGVYVFVIEGQANVSGTVLSRRDGMGIYDTNSVAIEALEDSEILLIEVPMV